MSDVGVVVMVVAFFAISGVLVARFEKLRWGGGEHALPRRRRDHARALPLPALRHAAAGEVL